jgi:ketosteroid isomerase-like protein
MADKPTTAEHIEHVFSAWDQALGARDVDAAIALYAPDATLESPLICYLLDTAEGIMRGRENLREFLEKKVFPTIPAKRRRFRAGFLTDGSRVVWEYPRESPDGDQMDIVEVMEIRDGLIAHHRVYWGWVSVATLTSGEHAK